MWDRFGQTIVFISYNNDLSGIIKSLLHGLVDDVGLRRCSWVWMATVFSESLKANICVAPKSWIEPIGLQVIVNFGWHVFASKLGGFSCILLLNFALESKVRAGKAEDATDVLANVHETRQCWERIDKNHGNRPENIDSAPFQLEYLYILSKDCGRGIVWRYVCLMQRVKSHMSFIDFCVYCLFIFGKGPFYLFNLHSPQLMGYGHSGAALFCLDISQQKTRNTAPVRRCFLMYFFPPKKRLTWHLPE